MRNLFNNWARLALVAVPLAICLEASAVLLHEQNQSRPDKAIRLVKESISRKEDSTVQQFLYSTIYWNRNQGQAIWIEGWRATPAAAPGGPIEVEFGYSEPGGRQVATWEADLEKRTVIPRNQLARDLSWR